MKLTNSLYARYSYLHTIEGAAVKLCASETKNQFRLKLHTTLVRELTIISVQTWKKRGTKLKFSWYIPGNYR